MSQIDLDKFEGHTPGPWRFERIGCKIFAGRVRIADVSVTRKDETELVADGRLLAAAPDILAHARNLEYALQELADALFDGQCNSGIPGFDYDRLDRAQDAARDALASHPCTSTGVDDHKT